MGSESRLNIIIDWVVLLRGNRKEERSKMRLNQPYYIEKREGENHVDLNGQWDFCWMDSKALDVGAIEFKYNSTIPASVIRCLNNIEMYPDPYVGLNSRLYNWVDEKVWYFRRQFQLNVQNNDIDAFLCFDGVGYYTRVWVNNNLLGEHEGMYGGPICNVANYLNFSGENEIIIEVKACNYGIKSTFDRKNEKGLNSQIIPWNLPNDCGVFEGDFNVFGIWNDVRIEFVDKLHLSRPFLYTVSANEDLAELCFEVEIATGKINELHPFFGYTETILTLSTLVEPSALTFSTLIGMLI